MSLRSFLILLFFFFDRLVDDREQRNSESSLAQLLRTDQAVSRRYNDHGGGLLNPTQLLGQTPRKSKRIFSRSSFYLFYLFFYISRYIKL